MIVGIIGMGRVGTALASALSLRGFNVIVCSRRSGSENCINLEGQSFKAVCLEQLASEVAVIFITTPDRVISQVVEELGKSPCKAWGVLHMSGSLGASILNPLRESGSLIGSLHPLQSFASIAEARENLPGSCFTYEGDSELVSWLNSLVRALGGSLQILASSESKILYHAGACLVSNYVVLLAELGVSCLEQAGFDREEAQKALLPLMRGTVNNLANLSVEKALTGPVARGDLEVVAAHLSKLEENLPEVRAAYSALTPLLGQLALRGKGLNPDKYLQLLEILGGVSDGKRNS